MHIEVDEEENKRKMLNGELFYSFSPGLIADRERCKHACTRYAERGEVSRRRAVEMWREISCDPRPLPPPAADPAADAALFDDEPWVEGPVHCDYGYNVHLGAGAYINANCTIIDSCTVRIGARTLFGPGVSLYAGGHPVDPLVRAGLRGPESGAPVVIGDDCWLGGGVTVLPGVTIGRGSTVGAGSVVTRDVPPFHVVAGNPARVIRRIETLMDPDQARAAGKEPLMPPGAGGSGGDGGGSGVVVGAAAAAVPGGMVTAQDALRGMQAERPGPGPGPASQGEKGGAEEEDEEQEEKSNPIDAERFWRAFASSEKNAAEGGAFKM